MSQREEEREEKRTRWGEKQKTIDKIIKKKRMEMKEKEAVFKKYFIFFVIVL